MATELYNKSMHDSIDWADLHSALKQQSEFSSLFFDAASMALKQRQEMLKTFVLSLHSEATGIVEGANFKDHRLLPDKIDTQKVMYKATDAYRYILAILNLCEVSSDEFIEALRQKDEFLHYRHTLASKQWTGQPIVLFDMDDVLATFREGFMDYIEKQTGVRLDTHSPEYYCVSLLKTNKISNDEMFKGFIENHGFLRLGIDQKYFNLLSHLKREGFWVQIVTARPAEELTCFYDTYSWLHRNGFDVDGVTFTPEKFRWLSEQGFYTSAKVFAVDDSPKHAAEYAKHNVQVIVPEKSYNHDVANLDNIIYVPEAADPLQFIPTL